MSDWGGWPVVAETAGWETVQEHLTEAGLSDGLPLVPPTQKRLEEALKRGDVKGCPTQGFCLKDFHLMWLAAASRFPIVAALPGG